MVCLDLEKIMESILNSFLWQQPSIAGPWSEDKKV